MPRAFIMRPFDTKTDARGNTIDFEKVEKDLIAPALEKVNLAGRTTKEIFEAGNIREDMFALIIEADLVICDITIHSANVFYELGIRHALRKKHTILIKGSPFGDKAPFDISTDRYLTYDINNPSLVLDAFIKCITDTLAAMRPTDSPVFLMLPHLPELNSEAIIVVPLEFSEEVDRAVAAKSKGWLRLLSEEVRGQRFEWEGLKLVGKAQWDLKDYGGGRESWEIIRRSNADDPAANLALANIYERLYREEKDEVLLTYSDQAIDRVLANNAKSNTRRVEALALKGRNEKTRWRLKFSGITNIDERRVAALNRMLIHSYEAYRDAFALDLNHFYSGLSAFQMGTLLHSLSDSTHWNSLFHTEKDAKDYKITLKEQLAAYRHIIPASIKSGLKNLPETSDEYTWARVSRADLLFLIEQREELRVINAYKAEVPAHNPFVWESTRGQLSLLSALGVRTELANKVIDTVDRLVDPHKPDKNVHLIVFAGHRIDTPDRTCPRFPPLAEQKAKGLIADSIKKINNANLETIILASAAPGADILMHEVCIEQEIRSIICLPMPPGEFARMAFHRLDIWRNRFLDLLNAKENTGFEKDILSLSNREDLPQWLRERNINQWERGNRWVLNMALAWGAERITLLALWDKQETIDPLGGTFHMVQIARGSGKTYEKIIDSRILLEP
jgi:hypothetical protein